MTRNRLIGFGSGCIAGGAVLGFGSGVALTAVIGVTVLLSIAVGALLTLALRLGAYLRIRTDRLQVDWQFLDRDRVTGGSTEGALSNDNDSADGGGGLGPN